jgi:hypothetical protein
MNEPKPHEQRVVAEYEELRERRVKLHSFIASETFLTLPEEDRELLAIQENLMDSLSGVMVRRIRRWIEASEAPSPTEPAWWAASLNRRATVEQWMFDAARGKRPMPTPQELRAWALKLGTPDHGEPAAGVPPSDGASNYDTRQFCNLANQAHGYGVKACADPAKCIALGECVESALACEKPVRPPGSCGVSAPDGEAKPKETP